MIENQTRDDLVRFNGDFGRVMVKMCIKKCGRRRGVKSEKICIQIRLKLPLFIVVQHPCPFMKGYDE